MWQSLGFRWMKVTEYRRQKIYGISVEAEEIKKHGNETFPCFGVFGLNQVYDFQSRCAGKVYAGIANLYNRMRKVISVDKDDGTFATVI